MPAFDFHCPTCDKTFEAFISTYAETHPCGECSTPSPYVASFWYNSRTNAQRFDPIVVHRSPEGEYRFPAHANAPIPPGFEKVELRDFHSVRKFESEVNAYETERLQMHQTATRNHYSAGAREGRAMLKEAMKNFSPRGKRLAENIMRAADAWDRNKESGMKSPETGFYVEAFSQNASNREAYYDRETDWKRRSK